MVDCISPDKRSWNMSRIRSRDTGPEMIIRRALHIRGYRFRVNNADLPGKPDIALRQYGAVVFIHGCFWHLHGCKYSKIPHTRHDWWEAKLTGNRNRDARAAAALKEQGWRVLTVWECAIDKDQHADQTINLICTWLKSGAGSIEIPSQQPQGTEASKYM